MEKFTPLANILHSRRERREGQISHFNASLLYLRTIRWLLGWKLQGGLFTKRRCAVPDFAASFQHFHCLETLREHFVLILLFRGITNISRI